MVSIICTATTMSESIIVIPANSELIIGIYKDETPSPDNQCALGLRGSSKTSYR